MPVVQPRQILGAHQPYTDTTTHVATSHRSLAPLRGIVVDRRGALGVLSQQTTQALTERRKVKVAY